MKKNSDKFTLKINLETQIQVSEQFESMYVVWSSRHDY